MPELLRQLPQNVARIFSGRNLLWHAVAIGLTILILNSGLDWSYYVATHKVIFLRLALPAIIVGTFLPLIAILAVLLAGVIAKNRRTITTAWALGQAALLGYLVSCFYKAFTGRKPPYIAWHSDGSAAPTVDNSHGFQFGFLKGGVFWGWPSSHTTVAFAMSLCLVALYPRNKALVFWAVAYALYIGLSVSVTIHWLSEFVAGTIFGSLTGWVVGCSFRPRMMQPRSPS